MSCFATTYAARRNRSLIKFNFCFLILFFSILTIVPFVSLHLANLLFHSDMTFYSPRNQIALLVVPPCCIWQFLMSLVQVDYTLLLLILTRHYSLFVYILSIACTVSVLFHLARPYCTVFFCENQLFFFTVISLSESSVSYK